MLNRLVILSSSLIARCVAVPGVKGGREGWWKRLMVKMVTSCSSPVIYALALVTWSPNFASLLNDFCKSDHNLYPEEDQLMAGIFKKGEQPEAKLFN